MKMTLYEWQRHNLTFMKQLQARLSSERENIDTELKSVGSVIAALESVKLKRPPKAAPVGSVKPKRKLSEAHKQALAKGRAKWAKKNVTKSKTKKEKVNA